MESNSCKHQLCITECINFLHIYGSADVHPSLHAHVSLLHNVALSLYYIFHHISQYNGKQLRLLYFCVLLNDSSVFFNTALLLLELIFAHSSTHLLTKFPVVLRISTNIQKFGSSQCLSFIFSCLQKSFTTHISQDKDIVLKYHHVCLFMLKKTSLVVNFG